MPQRHEAGGGSRFPTYPDHGPQCIVRPIAANHFPIFSSSHLTANGISVSELSLCPANLASLFNAYPTKSLHHRSPSHLDITVSIGLSCFHIPNQIFHLQHFLLQNLLTTLDCVLLVLNITSRNLLLPAHRSELIDNFTSCLQVSRQQATWPCNQNIFQVNPHLPPGRVNQTDQSLMIRKSPISPTRR